MGKWSLVGNSSRTRICIGGSGAGQVELSGRGKLELDIGELRQKGASESCLASLTALYAGDVDWYIVDNVALIANALKDYDAMGHKRAEAALRVVDANRDRGAGLLVLGDHSFITLALSRSEFEKVYRLFEATVTSAKGIGFRYALGGEFAVGLDKIHDHRPTAEQLASGAPLLSQWISILIHAGVVSETAG